MPTVSFAAKPSASSPSESALSCDSALSTRLLAGHWLCGVLEAIRDELQPGVAVEARHRTLDDVVAAADEDAVVAGALDDDAEDVPEVPVQRPARGWPDPRPAPRSSGSASRPGRRTGSCGRSSVPLLPAAMVTVDDRL